MDKPKPISMAAISTKGKTIDPVIKIAIIGGIFTVFMAMITAILAPIVVGLVNRALLPTSTPYC